jgi:hypothetical protein
VTILTLHATGPIGPDEVWERYAVPARWSQWAPQITGVEVPVARLVAGVRGRVRAPLGVTLPFVVDTVDEAARGCTCCTGSPRARTAAARRGCGSPGRRRWWSATRRWPTWRSAGWSARCAEGLPSSGQERAGLPGWTARTRPRGRLLGRGTSTGPSSTTGSAPPAGTRSPQRRCVGCSGRTDRSRRESFVDQDPDAGRGHVLAVDAEAEPGDQRPARCVVGVDDRGEAAETELAERDVQPGRAASVARPRPCACRARTKPSSTSSRGHGSRGGRRRLASRPRAHLWTSI